VQLQLDSHLNLIRAHDHRLGQLEERLDVAEARALEDHDEQLNRASENRVVLHGLPRLTGGNRQELRAAAFKKLGEVLSTTFPNLAGKFTLTSASYFDSEFPVYEGTLGSVSEATDLCRSFGKRSIASRKASGLKVLNSVTPATRVRLSILRTLTSAYKRVHANGTASLIGYLSRPVVKHRPEASGPFKTTGFVDTVLAMPLVELGLTDADFQHAYRAAGRRFPGKLSAYFLVLSDSSPLITAPNSNPRKRANDGTPVGASSSRRANMEVDDVSELEVFNFFPLPC